MLVGLGKPGRSEKELHDFMLAFYGRWLPVLDLPMPVITVLQGDCIGVAPVFACTADIAIADETLKLGNDNVCHLPICAVYCKCYVGQVFESTKEELLDAVVHESYG